VTDTESLAIHRTWFKIKAGLSAPLTDEEIEWKPNNFTGPKDAKEGWKGDGKALMLPYAQNRVIQQRLDDTCGVGNWQNVFDVWKPGAVRCGISIRLPGTSWAEATTKYDGADESDIEPTKGGFSNSMKRAAVHWGIGRELYSVPPTWVEAYVWVKEIGKWGRPKFSGKPQGTPRLPGAQANRPPKEPEQEPVDDRLSEELYADLSNRIKGAQDVDDLKDIAGIVKMHRESISPQRREQLLSTYKERMNEL